MASAEVVSRIHGIFPAVPTPFTEREEIDVTALCRVVRFLVEGGVHGLWVLGTGGEFAVLSDEQKRCVISTVVQEAGGRVPVLAGTGHGGTALAIRVAVLAAECGADALFVIPPYYYFYGDCEVLAHIRAVRDATPLPIILYHNPFNTKIQLPLASVQALCREERIIGIKDSSLNFDLLQALLRTVPRGGSFKVLTGNEMSLAASLLLGADGAVMALPTLAPRLCVKLYDAARAGDVNKAIALQAEAADLFSVFSQPGRSGDSAFVAGQKAALELLGLCSRSVSRPFLPFTDEEMDPVRRILDRHHLLSAAASLAAE